MCNTKNKIHINRYMRNKTKVQLAYQELLNSHSTNNNLDTFVTLTFQKIETMDSITNITKRYFIHLHRAVYGRQASKHKIQRIITIEHTEGSSHLHLMIEKPTHLKHLEFKNLMRDKWKRLVGTGKANLNNSEWYKEIKATQEDKDNSLFYITKTIDKHPENILIQCM